MPPGLLTRKQFLQKRPGGSYERYLSYVARKRGQRLAAQGPSAPSASFSPLTRRQVANRARSDVMPATIGAATAFTEALLGRAARSTTEINTRAGGIASALRPFTQSAGQAYNPQAEGALGSALRGAITGTGQALGQDLASVLASIQAPGQSGALAQGLEQTGAASGQAVGALSSAEMHKLKQQQTAEQVYAGALPRLAMLAGEQERRALLSQIGGQLTEGLAEIYGRIPELTTQALSGYQDQEFDKLLAREATKQESAKAQAKAQADAAKDAKRAQQLKPAPEQVNRSTGYIMGYNAAGQLVPYLGPDGKPIRYRPSKSGSTSKADKAKADKAKAEQEKKDYFYEQREEAASRARELAKGYKSSAGQQRSYTRAEARKRLISEFGYLLAGRGYSRKTVAQMIERVLDAAGF